MKTISLSLLISATIIFHTVSAATLDRNEQEKSGAPIHSSSVVLNSVNLFAEAFKEHLTRNMIAEGFRIFDRIFDPFSQPADSYMEDANDLWLSLNDPQSFIARSARLVDRSPSHYSELTTPGLHTMQQVIIAIGIKRRANYFAELKEELPLTPETGLSIAFRFLTEFVKSGALDHHLTFFQESIEKDQRDSVQKYAMREIVTTMGECLRYLVLNDMNDPLKDPLINKYVSQEEIAEFIRLRDCLYQSPEPENSGLMNMRFKKLKDKIAKSRFRTMEEYGNRVFSLLKKMQPEFKDLDLGSILPYLKTTWESQHRQEFETYILTEFDKLSIFETNHLRAFSEKIRRHDYARFYYKIICESFEKREAPSAVHSLVRKIWCISQLDTINRFP